MSAFVEWIEDWSQLIQRCNWYTFNFFQFQFEWDRVLGAVEFTFILMGLGLRARWTYTETEELRELHRRVQEIEDGTAELVPLDEAMEDIDRVLSEEEKNRP